MTGVHCHRGSRSGRWGYEATNALFAPAAGRVLVDISLALLQGATE